MDAPSGRSPAAPPPVRPRTPSTQQGPLRASRATGSTVPYRRRPRVPGRRIGLVLASALVLASGAPAWGAIVPWLYNVEAPIESQGATERRNASRIALREMLTRLTGLRSVPMTEPVREALNEPGPYYVQYRFLPGDSDRGTRLGVSFSPEAVRDLVSRAALPIWSANRPRGLAWLTADDAGLRTVLSRESDHPAAAGLRDRARYRGIEIDLPFMDFEDAAGVTPGDVWNRFPYAIEFASRRYEPDLILLGRTWRQPLGNWISEWELWLDGGTRSFSFDTPTAEDGAVRAVDLVADELMTRFAVVGRRSRPIELEIHGIGTVADYAALMRALAELEFIDRVELLAAAPTATTLRVTTRSSRPRLAELLNAYGVLRETDTAWPEASQVTATTRWRGAPSDDAAGPPMTLTWIGEG